MARAPKDLSPEEAQLEARRLDEQLRAVLAKVGFGETAITAWWNKVARPELGGRTAFQAWSRSEYEAVRQLVESEASQRFAKALAQKPEILKELTADSLLVCLGADPS